MIKEIKKIYKLILNFRDFVFRSNYFLSPTPYTLNKGAILVITLWLVSLLAIFGIGLSRLAWSSYYFSRWQASAFYSRIIADSVLLICKNDRKKDINPQYDILSEFFRDEVFECGEFEGRYSLVDEESLFNINTVSRSIIEELPSLNSNRAKEILEYRDKPFFPKEELLLVDEIETENYDEIKKIITVYGTGEVNINTCSEDILRRLGLTDNMIDDIVDFRNGYDGELYTEDDGVFDSVSNIVTILTDEYQFSMREQQIMVVLIGKKSLCVKSNNFRIVLGIYKNDRLLSDYSIIIGQNEKDKKMEIKEWKIM